MCLFKQNYLNCKGSKELFFSFQGSVCISAKDGRLRILLNDLLKNLIWNMLLLFLYFYGNISVFRYSTDSGMGVEKLIYVLSLK